MNAKKTRRGTTADAAKSGKGPRIARGAADGKIVKRHSPGTDRLRIEHVSPRARKGEKAVVLALSEFEDLTRRAEDAEDRRAILAAEAGHGTFLPAELVDRMIVGESPVRVFRDHRGMTVTALAERAGISKGYLSMVENGRKDGSLSLFRNLAEILEVEIDDLV